MTAVEYKEKKDSLRQLYEKALKDLAISYAEANNPYKIGDTFTDHIGSITITKWRVVVPVYSLPCMSYCGTILNKDGTPTKKKDNTRWAYQSNELK